MSPLPRASLRCCSPSSLSLAIALSLLACGANAQTQDASAAASAQISQLDAIKVTSSYQRA
ncbi:hypothetical protein Xkhy_11965 [Xanthomonas axonopodis pv. khayae]|nr:hypothetical protein Xkhy_11965 [Xanthomonas axonopodis pv. khayae]